MIMMKVGPTTIEQESEVSSSFTIQNPKRNRHARLGRASWYPYYAGFSSYFAQSLLASSALNQAACIGDPVKSSLETYRTIRNCIASQGIESS